MYIFVVQYGILVVTSTDDKGTSEIKKVGPGNIITLKRQYMLFQKTFPNPFLFIPCLSLNFKLKFDEKHVKLKR